MAFKFGNVAINVVEEENNVSFLVGEVVGDNKMKITGRYDNLYHAWNVITQHIGPQTVLPKKLEQYL